MMWFQKYCPTSSSQIVGCNRNVNLLKQWLKTFDGDGKPPTAKIAVCIGPVGTCKTTCARLCCNECERSVVEYQGFDLNSAKKVSKISKNLDCSSLLGMFGSDAKMQLTKKAVIVTDIDAMPSAALSELLKIVKKTKTPVIATCNLQPRNIGKQKFILKVYFNSPIKSAVITHFAKVCKLENFVHVDRGALVQIINDCGETDFRRIFNILEFIRTKSDKLTHENVEKLGSHKTEISKDNVFNLFKKLIGTEFYQDFDQKYQIFKQEDFMLPLFMFENYLQLGLRKPLNVVAELATDMSDAQVFANAMGSQQHYVLQEYYAILSTIHPSDVLLNGSWNFRPKFPNKSLLKN